MSNVKPGDIARIVDPGSQNHGKQLYIEKLFASHCPDCGSPVWFVEALEHCWNEQNACGNIESTERVKPGEIGSCCDKWLRRVEPPKDGADELLHEIVRAA